MVAADFIGLNIVGVTGKTGIGEVENEKRNMDKYTNPFFLVPNPLVQYHRPYFTRKQKTAEIAVLNFFIIVC